MEQVQAKKQWTEAERLELAAKLDADLDVFIEGLERKRYEEGWPEDRWQEEMDKHPFFMKKAPQPGDDVHPMFEGLQKLKYDPEENTKEELALNYKEDGNFYMKHRKFRMAVYSFTEGINTNCENPEIQAVLYNNRSAAHFFIKNYKSSLNDAQSALKFSPDYSKARWRAARCAFSLKKFDLCSQICEEILERDPSDEDAKKLLKNNRNQKLEVERNERKEAAEKKKKLTSFLFLCTILSEREVKFDDLPVDETVTEEFLKPKFLQLEDDPVHFDEKLQGLVWPAVFCYPEFLVSDFHTHIPEMTTMSVCLDAFDKEPLPYDTPNCYRSDNSHVYYENRKEGTFHKVDHRKTIQEVLKEDNFFVTKGCLIFYIVPKDSDVEKEFLSRERPAFNGPKVLSDVLH